MTYNTSWKASLIFSFISAWSFGKNLRNTGITTCLYQSSKFITSNSTTIPGVSGGWYMFASSARVQLSRN